MMYLPITLDTYPILADDLGALELLVKSFLDAGWHRSGERFTFTTTFGSVYCQVLISACGVPAVKDSPRLLFKDLP